MAGLGLFFTAATDQSVFIGGVISVLGLGLLMWLNGYLPREGVDMPYFAGPYRFVRYPQVLSRCLIMVGLLLASRQPSLYCVAVLILTPLYHRLSRSEDAALSIDLGSAASEYRALVSGLIPQLRPFKSLGVSRLGVRQFFSWRTAMLSRKSKTLIISGIVLLSLLGHYFWALRVFSEWQWRVGAFIFSSLIAGCFLTPFCRRAAITG